MKSKLLIISALCLPIISGCGESFKSIPDQGQRQFSSEEEEQPQVSTPTPQIPVGTDFRSQLYAAGFSAGAGLQASTLPTDDPNYALLLPSYLAETGWKAIAVSEDGSVFFAYNRLTPSESQSEASRRALEGCFVRSVAKDCALFAEGNYTKFAASQVFTQMQASTLPNIAANFDSADIPWVTDAAQNSLARYSSFQSYKALALNVEGGGCYRNEANSPQEAARRAQQCCEWNAKGLACIVYALEDQVAFDIKKHIYPDKLSFALAGAKFEPAKAPLVSDGIRTLLKNQYTQAVASTNNPIALALNENGDWAYREGSNESAARTAAINACNATNGSTSCLVYAINNKVVLTLEELESL